MTKALARRPPVALSRFDRFLIGIAPEWGMRRVRAKAAAGLVGRYYEAAAGGRRSAGWYRNAHDANAANATSLSALRELSRDLRRNNGWARRGVQTITNNTVGWGILAKPTVKRPKFADQVTTIWNAWADSVACDFEGRLSFYGLQRLVMETVVESGEALVVRQPADERDGLPVPLRIQVLEPDYLDLAKSVAPATREHDGIAIGHEVIQGIEFDATGRRVAYWLHRSHPGGTRSDGSTSRRVAAENVLHVCRVERPGQYRGVPWLAAAIVRLNDFDDYSDALLMQQKIAACFSAFVQDFDGQATALGEPDTEEPDKLEELQPGHIAYLPPGKSVTFATPPSIGDHAAFTATNLRRIAASIGVTYEDLTGDYSQVNFSSARMGRMAHWANVHDWRWNMMIPQFCAGVWRWFSSLAAVSQNWNEVPRAEWSAPPMPMLEPDREGLAYQRLVRTGAMTVYEMIRERGADPEAHLQEIAAGNKRLDELGIWLDADPRRTSNAGLTQERIGGGPNKPGGDDGASDGDDASSGE
jgi:lambda family phage portal protein